MKFIILQNLNPNPNLLHIRNQVSSLIKLVFHKYRFDLIKMYSIVWLPNIVKSIFRIVNDKFIFS